MRFVTPFDIARRFIGTAEVEGAVANSAILAMLRLDAKWPTDDSVPWCSAFVGYMAWLLDLPRSRSLAARSWLAIGTPVDLMEAMPGFDVVILKRGGGHQPGPEVLDAPGHVGFFVGHDMGEVQRVRILGGNQGDAVTIAPFLAANVLGVRRLA